MKLNNILSIISFLGILMVFIGLIYCIWLGFVGIKIMSTGLVSFLFSSILYAVFNDKQNESEDDDD